nr:hypothetical protein BGP89_13510 [Luteimonas sp. JM171]
MVSDISLATDAGLYTKQIDWDFIRNTLAYPHLKTGHTGLAGIHELLPGQALQLSLGSSMTRDVWTPWDFVSASKRYNDRRDALRAVREAVRSTVRAWADTDGSILLELSGGLDSSIVAAALMGSRADITCCNLVTPVPGADERLYAEQMAASLKSELHVQELSIDGAEFSFEPPPHAVTPSTWLLQHASNEAKEWIGQQVGARSYYSGGGGDTVFCFTKSAAPVVDAFNSRSFVCALRTIRNLAELHQCTVWKVTRLAARKLLGPAKPPRTPDHAFLSFKSDLEIAALHPWFSAPPAALPGDMERIFDLAGNQVFRDGIGRSSHRAFRMPLLSQPVMETCLKVPSWMWFANGRDRSIAREAFADRLPADIFHRRSKGTFMNYTGAVYRRNMHRMRDYLVNGRLAKHGLLDTDSLRKFLGSNPDTHGDSFMRIFDLCEVENWIRYQA